MSGVRLRISSTLLSTSLRPARPAFSSVSRPAELHTAHGDGDHDGDGDGEDDGEDDGDEVMDLSIYEVVASEVEVGAEASDSARSVLVASVETWSASITGSLSVLP